MASHIVKCVACFTLFLFIGCTHLPFTGSDADTATQTPGQDVEMATPEPDHKVPTDDMTASAEADHSLGDAEESAVPGDAAELEMTEAEAGERDVDPLVIAAAEPTAQQQLDEALTFCESAQEFWQKGELESALESLDQAYSLIIAVDPEGPSKVVQQKEDLRFLISKRILEIYASRNIVVNGNHKAIPREINRNVQREIDLFTKGPERRYFIESYQRSGKYRPMILKKLKAAGLPPELSWLPLIESGYKVKALSRARALGLWQFIPSTGYKFGLKRDQYIDERIDFEKSTDAAIAYLKELHSIFGDWSTVLAAYNCGEGRVLHVIRTQNINYLDDFWDLYGRLPFETARYVPRFLAALHVIENLDKYDMESVEAYPPLTFDTVEVNRQVSLKDIAAPLDTTLATLRDLNPELRYGVLPPSKYALRIPTGTQELLLASIDQLPLSSPPRPAYVYHRVRRGETLSTIARRYHTSVKKIMWANNMKRSSYIVAGKKLKIPQRGMVVTRAPSNTANTQENWNQRHVVKSGDSLWIIAKRYGTTTHKIQEMNHLSSTRLRINQVLKVPSQEEPSQQLAANGSGGTYHVRSGDSPYIIARKHNMSLNHFLKINDLTPRSTIYPGQSVRID